MFTVADLVSLSTNVYRAKPLVASPSRYSNIYIFRKKQMKEIQVFHF